MGILTIILYTFYSLIIIHIYIIIRKSLFILFYRNSEKNSEEKGFSIVVAARNEAENLKELIPLLLQQEYDQFEVIVVLDRCTDHSMHVVRSFTDEKLKVLQITNVPEGFNGKKYAISTGIRQAGFDWILLTDADCRPVSDEWIQHFNVQSDSSTEIILGLSPYGAEAGLLNALIRYETFQTAFNYVSSAVSGNPYMGVGRNLAYRKSLFIKAGGFGEFKHITGGDDDLFVQTHARPANIQLVLNRKGLTYSLPKRTWKEYLKQKTRHLSVGKHYRAKIKGKHFLYMTIHLLLWLSFLYLMFNFPDQWRIIGVFSLLLVVKGLFFTKIAKKTGLEYSIRWYPIVDFLFAVIMPLVGTRAIFVKNIKWN